MFNLACSSAGINKDVRFAYGKSRIGRKNGRGVEHDVFVDSCVFNSSKSRDRQLSLHNQEIFH